jgi:hypothetical protein
MPDKVIQGGDLLEAALQRIAGNLRNQTLSVGFLEGATYPDGTSVPMVAAIQEYGAPKVGIPPRPFFRNAIAKHKGEWADQIVDQLKKTHYDSNLTLDRMGAVIKGEIQDSIRDLQTPPLSPVTLMIRQIIGPNGTATFADVLEARRRVAAGEVASGVSTKPLVWTSLLLNSVNWKID